MHQVCSKSFLWMLNFEEKFSLDAPILKKSFLWMHPFWVCMGDPKTVPPSPPTRRTTLSCPWSVVCAADINVNVLSFQRQKPPSYFKTLLDILKILINFFYGDKLPQDETLLKMKSLLQLYASDSSELISRYLFERHKEQVTILKPNFKKFFLKKVFSPEVHPERRVHPRQPDCALPDAARAPSCGGTQRPAPQASWPAFDQGGGQELPRLQPKEEEPGLELQPLPLLAQPGLDEGQDQGLQVKPTGTGAEYKSIGEKLMFLLSSGRQPAPSGPVQLWSVRPLRSDASGAGDKVPSVAKVQDKGAEEDAVSALRRDIRLVSWKNLVEKHMVWCHTKTAFWGKIAVIYNVVSWAGGKNKKKIYCCDSPPVSWAVWVPWSCLTPICSWWSRTGALSQALEGLS